MPDLPLNPNLQTHLLPAGPHRRPRRVSPAPTFALGRTHGGLPSRRRPPSTPTGAATTAAPITDPGCSRGSRLVVFSRSSANTASAAASHRRPCTPNPAVRFLHGADQPENRVRHGLPGGSHNSPRSPATCRSAPSTRACSVPDAASITNGCHGTSPRSRPSTDTRHMVQDRHRSRGRLTNSVPAATESVGRTPLPATPTPSTLLKPA